MNERFHIQTLDNGLTVLGQRVEQVASAAVTILLDAGSAHDPAGAEGAAAVAGKWLLRGAGDRDTRQLHEALDHLGVQHSQRVHNEYLAVTASLLGRNLTEAMGLLADILRRPRLGDETFEPCRALTAQDLESLEDEPARKCNMLLRERFYPAPFGRCVYGTAASLAAMDPDTVGNHIRTRLGPDKAIVAVAGHIDWPEVLSTVQDLLGDWKPAGVGQVEPGPVENGVTHIAKDSAQTHIGLAHPAAGLDDPRYYAARVAQMVLSGGMASRLFTEVREKRGLVYHVSARYHAIRHKAGLFTYAGTEPAKAQETFDVTVAELRRLAEGIEQEEIDRAHVQARSSLVMQGESTSARAASMASDYRHLGRPRSLEEISEAIEAVTIDDVMDYLRAFPAEGFTILTIGPEPIDTAAAEAKP